MILLGPCPCKHCRSPVIVVSGPRVLEPSGAPHVCTVVIGDITSSPCACGGWIVVYRDTPRNIEEAVQLHQRTHQHRQWWDNGGFVQRGKAA